ncbi:MAG: hypothetical protein IH960_05015 [Chloroflexi bacterium]|nr:hypothetical protein [Chloroflexota bacterium]MCH8114654.1 hypothetical protein [Chloroflexota bacterium]MCH8230171.1 hypothetical protein [Chloroflexota bacterium]
MAKKEFPPPPDYQSIDTRMMTARELRETLDDLWEWVHRAEMALESDAPSDHLIQEIRQLMARIISERVERHADEPGRSAE